MHVSNEIYWLGVDYGKAEPVTVLWRLKGDGTLEILTDFVRDEADLQKAQVNPTTVGRKTNSNPECLGAE